MRRLIGLAMTGALASCVSAPRPAPPPRPVPSPPPIAALPAAPPRIDWRDTPLTPGRWLWRRDASGASLSQYGMPGMAALFAMRCDAARRTIVFTRANALGIPNASMTVTTSFGIFAFAVHDGGVAGGIVGELPAGDARLDQLAFSRGRFLVDVPGQARLVVPSWPEAARVIEDCRG